MLTSDEEQTGEVPLTHMSSLSCFGYDRRISVQLPDFFPVLLGRNFEDKLRMNDSRAPLEVKDRETRRNG